MTAFEALTGAPPCLRCGEDHPAVRCPHVKAAEFHEDGALRRLEFLTPADFPSAPAKSEADDGMATDYPKIKPGWGP